MSEADEQSDVPDAGWMKIARYANNEDAEIDAAELRANGFQAQVFGAKSTNLNAAYQAADDVELWVPDKEAQRASEFLKRAAAKTPEPPQESEETQGDVDQKGRALVLAGEYETARELRDAETLLASARIATFVATRESSFILRVANEDLDAAQELLAEEVEDADEPKCPKCGSWRTHAVSSFFAEIASAFGSKATAKMTECLACQYRGPTAEFWPQNPGEM